jgi:hypothetical protein
VKPGTVFLREGCILPDGFDLRREPFSKGWTEAIGVGVPELDAGIRNAGWHFMSLTDACTSRGRGGTPDTAMNRALVRALKHVAQRFNAAELSSSQSTHCLGMQMAKVTLQTRHIQQHTSIDSAAESRLQQVLSQ